MNARRIRSLTLNKTILTFYFIGERKSTSCYLSTEDSLILGKQYRANGLLDYIVHLKQSLSADGERMGSYTSCMVATARPLGPSPEIFDTSNISGRFKQFLFTVKKKEIARTSSDLLLPRRYRSSKKKGLCKE